MAMFKETHMIDRETKLGLFIGVASVFIGSVLYAEYAKRATTVTQPASVLAATTTKLDMGALLRAHGMAESGNTNPPPYQDRKQRSWGRYSFGIARWEESGGKRSQWGKASVAEQDRVMRNALRRYLRNVPNDSTVEDAVIWTANFHNRGHGSLKRTAHANKVLGFYRKGLR